MNEFKIVGMAALIALSCGASIGLLLWLSNYAIENPLLISVILDIIGLGFIVFLIWLCWPQYKSKGVHHAT